MVRISVCGVSAQDSATLTRLGLQMWLGLTRRKCIWRHVTACEVWLRRVGLEWTSSQAKVLK